MCPVRLLTLANTLEFARALPRHYTDARCSANAKLRCNLLDMDCLSSPFWCLVFASWWSLVIVATFHITFSSGCWVPCASMGFAGSVIAYFIIFKAAYNRMRREKCASERMRRRLLVITPQLIRRKILQEERFRSALCATWAWYVQVDEKLFCCRMWTMCSPQPTFN